MKYSRKKAVSILVIKENGKSNGTKDSLLFLNAVGMVDLPGQASQCNDNCGHLDRSSELFQGH
jgi:hypothetical protein